MLLCRLCISIAMLLGFSVFATAQLTLSADCDSGTADLSGITTANPPANTTLTWHSATPVSNANLIANVTALSPGTYYAAFYSAVDDCYSPGTTVEVVPACCLDNICPATTVDLTTALSAATTPAGTTLSYHTAIPVSAANQVAAPTAVAAGSYYIAFYDAAGDCYSGDGLGASEVIVNIVTCDPCQDAINNGTDVCAAMLADPTSPLFGLDCDSGGVNNEIECFGPDGLPGTPDDPTTPGDPLAAADDACQDAINNGTDCRPCQSTSWIRL